MLLLLRLLLLLLLLLLRCVGVDRVVRESACVCIMCACVQRHKRNDNTSPAVDQLKASRRNRRATKLHELSTTFPDHRREAREEKRVRGQYLWCRRCVARMEN